MSRALLIASLFAATAAIAAFAACTSLTQPPSPESIASGTPTAASAPRPALSASAAPRGPMDAGGARLAVRDVVVGKGATAQPGDTISVQYVGKLMERDRVRQLAKWR